MSQQGASNSFIKAFIPGLIVGFIVGAAVGVVISATGGDVGKLTASNQPTITTPGAPRDGRDELSEEIDAAAETVQDGADQVQDAVEDGAEEVKDAVDELVPQGNDGNG
jgi:hypothetical protein